MKIGSKIKPRDGTARRVTVHQRLYVFAPVQDHKGDVHFVTDVANEQHAETFMRSGDFYKFGAELEPQATLQRALVPEGSAGAPEGSVGSSGGAEGGAGVGTGPATGNVAVSFSEAERVEAGALLSGSANTISTAIGSVSTLNIIRCARELEEAGQNRKTVVQLLDQALAGAALANVKG